MAALKAEAVQLAFGAESVDAAVIDNRTAARTIVVAVAIGIRGRISELPEAASGFGFKAFDDFFVADAMNEGELLFENRRRRVAAAFLHLPKKRRTRRGEGFQKLGFRRHCIEG